MKPIYTKFFGDQDKAKSLMPKARSRIKHLEQKGGKFLGGVRIDRSLWDDVEITVFEYQDLYVIRIDAPLGPKPKERQGGVWCIPIDDFRAGSLGGYDFLGDPIVDRLIVGPRPRFDNNGELWNPQGSWSYMTLDPDDSRRGVRGPHDSSVATFIDPSSSNPQTLDPDAQFHLFPEYGLAPRGNSYSYHADSNSYLSWDMGWREVFHIGFTADDITNGRTFHHTDRYFGIPSGDVLYWNGHILGEVPSKSTARAADSRNIIGAGIVGGGIEDLTVIVVLGDFTDETYGTYLDQVNNIRKSTASVWKRSFPGNRDPDFSWGSADEIGYEDPETGQISTGGWVKLGDLEIPAEWDLGTTITNKDLNGDAYTSWYSRFCRFIGTAAWNEQPKTRLNGSKIYEFSGTIAATAGLEQENNPTPGDFPVRLPTDQDVVLSADFQFCGTEVAASFYTITFNEDLTGFTVAWDNAALIPQDQTLRELCSPWAIGFDPILRGVEDANGWIRGAVDYRNGEKTYLEMRTYYDNSKYPEYGQNSLELNWSNRVNQFKWNNHSFTGTANYYFQDGSTAGDVAPFDYDVDLKEFVIMGLDMRRDVAWIAQYYAQKRRETTPLEPEYYNTFVGQSMTHYLVRPIDPTDPDSAAEVVTMYSELDGSESLGPYNLNGDISAPVAPFNTLAGDLDDPYGVDIVTCTDVSAIVWIDNIHPGQVAMGLNSVYAGEQGSNRGIRISGDRPSLIRDSGRIQHSKVGFGVCHNGDTFCAKVASVFGWGGSGYNDSPEFTGVQYYIRPPSPNQEKCIMWDSLNGLNSYVETFNCPNNDQDCLWLGVIG